jgi:hypothetical protein
MAPHKVIFSRSRSRIIISAVFLALFATGCLLINYRVNLAADGSGTADISIRVPAEHRDLIESALPDFPSSVEKLKKLYGDRDSVVLHDVSETTLGGVITLKAKLTFDWIGDISTARNLFVFLPSSSAGPKLRLITRRGDLPVDEIVAKIEERARKAPRYANQNPKNIARTVMENGGYTISVQLPGEIESCVNADCEMRKFLHKVTLADLQKSKIHISEIVYRFSLYERLKRLLSGKVVHDG